MERLGSAQHRGHCLQSHARNVVHRLLCRERNARRLSMETQQPGAGILRAEAGIHYLTPDLTRGAVLGDLFEEVIVGVEEEAKPRAEFINIESTPPRPLDVLNAVIQSEGQLLQRGRAGLADVVSAD